MKLKQLLTSLPLTVACGTTPGEVVHTASISNPTPVSSPASSQSSNVVVPSKPPSPPPEDFVKPCSYSDNDCEKSCQNTDPVSGCVYTCTCNVQKKTECEVVCPSGVCPPKAGQGFVCTSTKEKQCYYQIGSCLCDLESTKKWQCVF